MNQYRGRGSIQGLGFARSTSPDMARDEKNRSDSGGLQLEGAVSSRVAPAQVPVVETTNG